MPILNTNNVVKKVKISRETNKPKPVGSLAQGGY